MGLLLSGRQLHAFFQDPRYWGRGQSFRNLALRVNGRPVGPEECVAGWDVADLRDDDIVEVVGGTWMGQGCVLACRDMPGVVECWLRGVVPLQPSMEKMAPPVPSGRPVFSEPSPAVETSNPGPAVKRPSFSLR